MLVQAAAGRSGCPRASSPHLRLPAPSHTGATTLTAHISALRGCRSLLSCASHGGGTTSSPPAWRRRVMCMLRPDKTMISWMHCLYQCFPNTLLGRILECGGRTWLCPLNSSGGGPARRLSSRQMITQPLSVLLQH